MAFTHWRFSIDCSKYTIKEEKKLLLAHSGDRVEKCHTLQTGLRQLNVHFQKISLCRGRWAGWGKMGSVC